MAEKCMSFKLPDEMYSALRKVAEKSDRSISYIVRTAIVRYFEDIVDIRSIYKYEQACKNGTLETRSLEEVADELGIKLDS
ncbi:MAG: ribbon-helix-helix domain-containing protein [Rickettsiales bacterium]|jgi:predicted DNA-binding protein|nr:ribbon-helix-helix domain-containing protein [Rickettsiales bacterium]